MIFEPITTLNYAAHALVDLRVMAEELRDVARYSAHALRGLINQIEQADKYVLPNCCNLVDPYLLGQVHLDLARLPSPCTLFEASWVKADDSITELAGIAQYQSSKRIAFCWDTRHDFDFLPGMNNQFSKLHPGGGTFILPIFYDDSSGCWTLGLGGCFLPFKNATQEIKETDETPEATIIASMAVIEAGLAKPTAPHFLCEPFVFLMESFALMVDELGGDREKALANIILDARDEVIMFVQAGSVLSCANVDLADVPFSAALNKKRLNSGKQPFFHYKVMRLKGDGSACHLQAGNVEANDGCFMWVADTES